MTAVTADPTRRFPDGFLWGSATSSYQIEGATDVDGRGVSIWDTFCARPGTIADGTSGTVACDHYHRWAEDVALMRSLGLAAYRFSIAWPRVLPTGRGAVNAAGIDFYDRLVDGLLAAGIEPFPTLYHWDLPQALEDEGGWTVRSTAEAMADYAGVMVERLGDRVSNWTTINEPFVVANHGYLTGEHAPGRSSLADYLAASHHILLAHGLAAARIRELQPAARVGATLNFTPAEQMSDTPAGADRFRTIDDLENRWYVEPIAGLGYPATTVARLGWNQAEVLPGDLDLISQPLDFLGVNFYTRNLVGALEGEQVPHVNADTDMGWEIHPPSIGRLMRELHARDRFPAFYITENGAAMPDLARTDDGRVDDADRLAYLHDHLAELHGAVADGVPLRGYFTWSLLDNFEWAHGYAKKFGIVAIDPVTLDRTPKRSALWYAGVATSNELSNPL